tara:strand:- start:418 stop:1251 length:834 start_codon:yes stop_codon:yes gene_type:complete
MSLSIISWNVAGLRARVKQDGNLDSSLSSALFKQTHENGELKHFDIVCLQETKCTETDIILSSEIINKYPHRFWNSTHGTTQRKGLSGTSIWCVNQPIKNLTTPKFDVEGRIVAVEFEKFILVNVYVPNSQKIDSDRFKYRKQWNYEFAEYLLFLKKEKNIIVCGDMNVAHLDIDINNPKTKKNKVAGFYDFEREDFSLLLLKLDLVDVFRSLNPTKEKSSYWSNFMKVARQDNNGWGLDYFLICKELFNKNKVNNIEICKGVMGSDHCPVILYFYI